MPIGKLFGAPRPGSPIPASPISPPRRRHKYGFHHVMAHAPLELQIPELSISPSIPKSKRTASQPSSPSPRAGSPRKPGSMLGDPDGPFAVLITRWTRHGRAVTRVRRRVLCSRVSLCMKSGAIGAFDHIGPRPFNLRIRSTMFLSGAHRLVCGPGICPSQMCSARGLPEARRAPWFSTAPLVPSPPIGALRYSSTFPGAHPGHR